MSNRKSTIVQKDRTATISSPTSTGMLEPTTLSTNQNPRLPYDHPPNSTSTTLLRNLIRIDSTNLIPNRTKTLLESLCEESNGKLTTPFAPLLAILGVLIARYSGSDVFTVGAVVPSFGDEVDEDGNEIFFNVVPVSIEYRRKESFVTLAERVEAKVQEAFGKYQESLVGAGTGSVVGSNVGNESSVSVVTSPKSSNNARSNGAEMVTSPTSSSSSSAGGAATASNTRTETPTILFGVRLDPSENWTSFLNSSTRTLPSCHLALHLDLDDASTTTLYDASLFKEQTVSRMLVHFRTLLEAGLADPVRTPVGRLGMLTEAERVRQLVEWNRGSGGSGSSSGSGGNLTRTRTLGGNSSQGGVVLINETDYKPLHVLFDECVLRHPHRSALVEIINGAGPTTTTTTIPTKTLASTKSYTYLSLQHRSNRIARYLGKGIGGGGASLKGKHIIIINACDPFSSSSMTASSAPLVVVCGGNGKVKGDVAEAVKGADVIVEMLGTSEMEDILKRVEESTVGDVPKIVASDLAYVFFTTTTSSDILPIGVQVTHASLAHNAQWHRDLLTFTDRDRLAAISSVSSHHFAGSLWCSLTTGASFLPLDPFLTSMQTITQLIAKESVTTVHAPASVWPSVLESPTVSDTNSLTTPSSTNNSSATSTPLPWYTSTAISRLRSTLIMATSSSDALNYVPTRSSISPEGYPGTVLLCYGTPEAGLVATCVSPVAAVISENEAVLSPRNGYGGGFGGDDVKIVPVDVGRVVKGVFVFLLDGDMQPVPVGVMGEVYIGGIGVGRGYIGNNALTASRFVRNPYQSLAGGQVLFRTGDWGIQSPKTGSLRLCLSDMAGSHASGFIHHGLHRVQGDRLIHVGGVTVPVAVIETEIQKVAGAEQSCVVVLPGSLLTVLKNALRAADEEVMESSHRLQVLVAVVKEEEVSRSMVSGPIVKRLSPEIELRIRSVLASKAIPAYLRPLFYISVNDPRLLTGSVHDAVSTFAPLLFPHPLSVVIPQSNVRSPSPAASFSSSSSKSPVIASRAALMLEGVAPGSTGSIRGRSPPPPPITVTPKTPTPPLPPSEPTIPLPPMPTSDQAVVVVAPVPVPAADATNMLSFIPTSPITSPRATERNRNSSGSSSGGILSPNSSQSSNPSLSTANSRRTRIPVTLPTIYKPDAKPSTAYSASAMQIELMKGREKQLIPAELLYLEFGGNLDYNYLARAIDAVTRRHTVLRSIFVESPNGNINVRVDLEKRVRMNLVSLVSSPTLQDPETARMIRDTVTMSEGNERGNNGSNGVKSTVDLGVGGNELPLRAWLFEFRSGDVVNHKNGDDNSTMSDKRILVFVYLKAVMDAWSCRIFLSDLSSAYNCISRNLPPFKFIQTAPRHYIDFAAWHVEHLAAGDIRRDQLAYWTMKLASVENLTAVPLDVKKQTSPGDDEYGWLRFDVDRFLVAKLREYSRKFKCSVNQACLGALATTLHIWSTPVTPQPASQQSSNVSSILIAQNVTLRKTPETSSIVGPLSNTVLLRVDVDKSSTKVSDLSTMLRRAILESMDSNDVPFSEVTRHVQRIYPAWKTQGVVAFEYVSSGTGGESNAGQEALTAATFRKVPGRVEIFGEANSFDLLFTLEEDDGLGARQQQNQQGSSSPNMLLG
ncbi:hypothetical protein HDU76_003990, partial [Blyttiomyces sp. JEL0837]